MWKKVWPKELERMSEPRDHSKYCFYLFFLELLKSFGHQGKCLEMFGHGFAEALKQWYTMMHLRMASAATSSLFAENAPWRRQSLVWSWPFIVAQFPGRESGAGGLREWSWWPQLRQQCVLLPCMWCCWRQSSYWLTLRSSLKPPIYPACKKWILIPTKFCSKCAPAIGLSRTCRVHYFSHFFVVVVMLSICSCAKPC